MRWTISIAKHLRTFREERSLLRKKRFELTEIHDRRIDFDLAKVGIDRPGERQVRRQAVLHVDAAIHLHLMRSRERIALIDAARQIAARDAVRHHFEGTLRFDPFNAGEIGEARDHSVLALRRVHEAIDFVRLGDAPEEVDAPGLRRLIGKAQLRIRNADFSDPAAGNNLRIGEPDGIPTPIVVDVVVEDAVDLHIRRIDPELRAGEAVVLRIDVDAERVGFETVVAAAQECGDRIGVIHDRADVDRVVVVDDFHDRFLCRRFAVVGIVLRELGDLLCVPPRFVGEIAVDRGRLGDARGAKRGTRLRRISDESGSKYGDECERC